MCAKNRQTAERSRNYVILSIQTIKSLCLIIALLSNLMASYDVALRLDCTLFRYSHRDLALKCSGQSVVCLSRSYNARNDASQPIVFNSHVKSHRMSLSLLGRAVSCQDMTKCYK
jgi:hypothetical protein